MPPAPPAENVYPPIAASDRTPAPPEQDRSTAEEIQDKGAPDQQGYDAPDQRPSAYSGQGGSAYDQRPTADSRPDAGYGGGKPEQPEYKNQGGGYRQGGGYGGG